jgi:hypothetical protein
VSSNGCQDFPEARSLCVAELQYAIVHGNGWPTDPDYCAATAVSSQS